MSPPPHYVFPPQKKHHLKFLTSEIFHHPWHLTPRPRHSLKALMRPAERHWPTGSTISNLSSIRSPFFVGFEAKNPTEKCPTLKKNGENPHPGKTPVGKKVKSVWSGFSRCGLVCFLNLLVPKKNDGNENGIRRCSVLNALCDWSFSAEV